MNKKIKELKEKNKALKKKIREMQKIQNRDYKNINIGINKIFEGLELIKDINNK